MPIPGKPAAPGSSSGPMMIQSISNIKIIEFTVSQLLGWPDWHSRRFQRNTG